MRAEYVSPDENLAHKRAWATLDRRQPRHSWLGGLRAQGRRRGSPHVDRGGGAALERAGGGIHAANSVLTHTPSGQTLRYGEVAADATKLPVPTEVKLKSPAQWTIIRQGCRATRHSRQTIRQAGVRRRRATARLLDAAIAQCPVYDGKLKSFDADKIKWMPGVRHVVAVGDNAVAVVADKCYRAKTALAALPIVWDEGHSATVDSAQIADLLKGGLDAKEAALGQKHGDVEASLAGAQR